MYSLFANVKTNKSGTKTRITSIILKKVLSPSTSSYSFDTLQSNLVTDGVYIIKIQEKLINQKLIEKLLKYSTSGLFFIKSIDIENKKFELVVPTMLVNDYKSYMKVFEKEFKNINKSKYINNDNFTKDIHNTLKVTKLTLAGLINRIMLRISKKIKYPTDFTFKDLQSLTKDLDNKGNNNRCAFGFQKYFSIKPELQTNNICKKYFKINPTQHSSTYVEKSLKKAKNIKPPKKKKKSQLNKMLGSIGKVMGKPKTKVKSPKPSKTETKFKLKNIKKREKRREEDRKLNKMISGKGKLDYEHYGKKKTIKNNEPGILILFRAIIITIIIFSIIGKTNIVLYKSLMNIILAPIKLLDNLCKSLNI